MDRQDIHNADINKSKELFEYEMTQVILELKGEFAAISGKDVNYAGTIADEVNLDIAPISIPQVEMEENKIAPPEAVAINGIEIPDVEIKNISINAPDAKGITETLIPEIKLQKSTIEIPEIPGIRSAADSAAAMTVSENIAKIGISSELSKGTAININIAPMTVAADSVQSIAVPEIPEIKATEKTDVSTGKISVSLPDTDIAEINVKKAEAATEIKTDIPVVNDIRADVEKMKSIAAPAVAININVPDTSLPEIPGITIPKQPSSVSKDEEEKLAQRIKELMEMEIPRPEIPKDIFASPAALADNIEIPEKPDTEAAKAEILKAFSIG